MRNVAHNRKQMRNVAHNREQNAYKVLLGEVQSLHSVLQHEFVLELIAALRSFASSIFSPKPDR
jgi:hypothetical protein